MADEPKVRIRMVEAAVLFSTYVNASGTKNGVRRSIDSGVEHYAAVASVEGAERLADILNLCQALVEDHHLVAADEMFARGLISGLVRRALTPDPTGTGSPL